MWCLRRYPYLTHGRLLQFLQGWGSPKPQVLNQSIYKVEFLEGQGLKQNNLLGKWRFPRITQWDHYYYKKIIIFIEKFHLKAEFRKYYYIVRETLVNFTFIFSIFASDIPFIWHIFRLVVICTPYRNNNNQSNSIQ